MGILGTVGPVVGFVGKALAKGAFEGMKIGYKVAKCGGGGVLKGTAKGALTGAKVAGKVIFRG